MAEKRADVAIVGAGILGLAHAWHAARAGKRVVIFERHPQAQGASVRNYGLIWPIGQAAGFLHQTAMRSRELWTDILNTYKLPSLATGSMHVCYRDDEADVAKEFCTLAPKQGYTCEWLEPKRAIEKCDALRPHGLKGALFSPTEITIDARTVMRELPRLLGERYRVETRFGYPVRRIELPVVETSEESWRVESAIVCTGDDFETLFPADYKASGLSRCKMQMLRTVPQPKGWKLGPALAGGITMRSYGAFAMCTSLDALKKRIASENPKYERWGVHVIVSQHGGGELTIGDSHEYGQTTDFFDKADIEDLILDTLDSFTMFPDRTIAQRWNGVFAGHPEKPIVVATPAKGVLIVTGAGGAGLTLGLGLAERICKKFFE
ncbi:MAG TPA: TIGR03364 family FAD-dependent oxidoreductase [Bryobacteraceae bacterium]|nr:TIGR03364 family FAD-dependent oxidoreductase [Bryobacteraceae bacterium]